MSIFWKKLFPARSRRDKLERASAARCVNRWNLLPPELVDEILRYLSEDLPTLKACSLTCKILHDSARPLIGSWLFLSPGSKRKTNARSIKSLLHRPKKDVGTLERLSEIQSRGLLPHTRYLVLKMEEHADLLRSLQPFAPYFFSILKLQSLVVDGLDVTAFIPYFHICLGMFTNSLRSLDIRHIWDSDRQLLWFISQFPLLEDLSIRHCYALYFFLGPSPPLIRTSPPFRGHLNLSLIMDSQSLCEALAQFPGGLNFTSIELKGCGKPSAVINACQPSLRSVSYTWTTALSEFFFAPFGITRVLITPFSRRSCPRPQRLFRTREIRVQRRSCEPHQFPGLALSDPLEDQLSSVQRIHHFSFRVPVRP